MLTANFFAAALPALPDSLAKPRAGRSGLMPKLLIALMVLTATLWQATGTTLAQEPDPAAETATAAATDGEVVDKATDETKAGGDTKAGGLDEQIDKAFKPIADFWGGIVFYPAKFGSTEGFRDADADQDGKFNAAEYEAFSGDDGEAKTLADLDTDKDGLLTPAEVGQQTEVPFIIFVLVGGAAFFTLVFGFINIRLIPFAIRVVSGKYDDVEKSGLEAAQQVAVNEVDGDLVDTIRDEGEGEVSHFQALATAVSGTVGLGNIAGVAVAIATGGPGATFWMILCGLLGMSTKFVECTLGVKYRDVDENGTVYGGPMYYLSKGFTEMGIGPFGKVLSVIFAVLCVGGSFGGGNAFQSNQAAQQIVTLCGLEDVGYAGTLIGLGMAVLVGIVIIGGIKRIAKVTEKIVPLMAVTYVVAALVIIGLNIGNVPAAISAIFSGAFTPEAGLGGLLGVLIQGFKRAAFSNEAGAGSASIAHSAVKTNYPASEGVVALLEPFIDTVVICTLTALVIVMFNLPGANDQSAFPYGDVEGNAVLLTMVDDAGVATTTRTGGVDLTSAAFDSALPGFKYVLTIAVILFAFSTMVSWSYYGMQAWKYLFGKSAAADLTYKLLFCAVVVIGGAISLGSVIDFSDAMILAMVFPNMIGLVFLFPKVRAELSKYMAAIKASK